MNTDEERKCIIKVAIVRVMKIYKILKHQELITEVMNQVALRFIPQIKIIKVCIET